MRKDGKVLGDKRNNFCRTRLSESVLICVALPCHALFLGKQRKACMGGMVRLKYAGHRLKDKDRGGTYAGISAMESGGMLCMFDIYKRGSNLGAFLRMA